MPGDNVEALRRVYEGWARGDFTAGVDLLDEHASLVLRPEFPDSGVHAGTDGIRRYMAHFLEPWERLTIAADSFREAGDTVLVAVTQRGTGRGSQAPAELRYFHVWTFRGGRAIRMESIMREGEALAAVGLADDA